MSTAMMKTHAASKAKGDAFKKEAEAALNRFSFFGFAKEGNNQDAAGLYQQAGNMYKLGNEWNDAGDVFKLASEYHSKSDAGHDAIINMVEAAKAYQKDMIVDPSKCVDTFMVVIEMYNMKGDFSRSAKYMEEVAAIKEAASDKEGALEAYYQAADLYSSDNKSRTKGEGCNQKIALLLAELNDFIGASDIYKKMGTECMSSNLGKYQAKNHFFAYLLCRLAIGDSVAVSNGSEECCNIDPSFNNSRECNFVNQLVQAMSDSDVPAFAQACADWDRISPLDSWKTSLLVKARGTIMVEEEEEDELKDLTDLGEVGVEDLTTPVSVSASVSESNGGSNGGDGEISAEGVGGAVDVEQDDDDEDEDLL